MADHHHLSRSTWRRVVALLWLLMTALALAPATAVAATPGSPLAADAKAPEVRLPETLTREQVRDLVARMPDDQVRQLLIGQLDKVAAADTAKTQPSGPSLDSVLVAAQWRLQTAIDAVPNFLGLFSTIGAKLPQGGGALATTLVFTVLVFALGFAAEALFRRAFPAFHAEPDAGRSARASEKLSLLGMRLLRDLLALCVFGLGATAMFFVFWHGNEVVRAAETSVFWTIIIVRGVSALSRSFLAPGSAGPMRLIGLTNAAASGLHRRIVLMAAVITAAYYLGIFISNHNPDESGALVILTATLSLFVLCCVLVVVWLDRRAFRDALLARDAEDREPPGKFIEFLARHWHVLVTAFLSLVWVLHVGRRLLTGEADAGPMLVSLLALAALPAFDLVIRDALKALLKVRESAAALEAAVAAEAEARVAMEAGPGLPDDADPDLITARRNALSDNLTAAVTARNAAQRTLQARRDYRSVLLQSLRIVLGVVFVAVLAKVWDVNLQTVAAQGVGETLAGAALDIIAVLLIASAAWGIVKAAIRNALPPERGEDGGESEAGGQGGTRLQTLVPLFGRFMLVVIAVLVTLIILSELGVDIGPLIAGAGVIGIAIGFGAQTLVRDILSGVFFLIDDAFRVGEYIDVGKVRGTVEHISIRSFRLRHHLGPVHTIPFGEIQYLTNFSRDWAIMKLELRVPFETDLELVRKIVKKVGQELLAHPEYGKGFLQPVKSQGVNRMDDDAFIVRVKFMAKPGEQFVIRREVYRRIQEAFARSGIHFAPRRVIVDTTSGSGTPLAAAALAAAAAAVIDTDKAGEGPEDGGHDM